MSIFGARMSLSTAKFMNGMPRLHNLLVILLLFLLAVSCTKSKRPSDILTDEQMAAIMVEVYLAESRVNGALIPRDSGVGVFRPFEKRLLEGRGIPDSVLKKTYAYYLAHPSEFEKVYDSVIDSLALREQRLKNESNAR
jgi:hypothetical protein